MAFIRIATPRGSAQPRGMGSDRGLQQSRRRDQEPAQWCWPRAAIGSTVQAGRQLPMSAGRALQNIATSRRAGRARGPGWESRGGRPKGWFLVVPRRSPDALAGTPIERRVPLRGVLAADSTLCPPRHNEWSFDDWRQKTQASTSVLMGRAGAASRRVSRIS